MTVEQTYVIDHLGIDRISGCANLAILDHLDWVDSENEHLFLLQEKINTYLAFIESGEIFDTYPQAKGRQLCISIVAKHPFSDAVLRFYDRVSSVLQGVNVDFSYRVYDQGALGDSML